MPDSVNLSLLLWIFSFFIFFVRELFLLDPRVNPSHTFVYEDTPYWDSHCLNKDVPSIANQFNVTLLKDIIKFNNKQKENNN